MGVKTRLIFVAFAVLLFAALACGDSDRVDLATEVVEVQTVEEAESDEVEAAEEEQEESPLATDTPELTNTPEPEPIIAMEILSSSTYVDTIGSIHVVGELQNTGDLPLAFVQVVVSFYDVNEAFLAGESSYTSTDIVYPGELAPFHIFAMDIPDFASYELQVQGEEAENWYMAGNYRDFEFAGDSMSPGTFADYVIQGQVTNTGEQTAEFVEIIVTLYDAEGNVV